MRSEASGAGCGKRTSMADCNMNEYSASNFWCSVVGDAVECNTRPKATLRSLFVVSSFFLLFDGEGRVERGFVQLAHRLILYVCRHMSSVLCVSPLGSTQQLKKARGEIASVENYSTTTVTGLECQASSY